MKKLYIINYILTILCVAGTAALLVFTPDIVPVHYDFSGIVDRFGSKYELIVFPIITLVMEIILIVSAKQLNKKKEYTNEKIILITGVLITILLTVLGFYFEIKAMKYNPSEITSIDLDINKFTSIVIGILLVVMGLLMPKAKRNSLMGIRTKWSMANDETWKKSQVFGGVASIACGLVMIIASIFVPGMWNILLMVTIMTALVISSVVASFHFYKKQGK